MSLNTRVHIVSKSGKKESITARELLARGEGSAFEAFQMLDEYDRLAEDYAAELAAAAAVAAEQQDREDHLPLGAHLLPQDYQDFLYSWNKAIATAPGCRSWNGISRDIYKCTNKEAWKQWVAKNKEFRVRYTAEVEQVVAYQASHPIEEDEEEDELDSAPPLPPSPILAVEQPGEDQQPDDEQLDEQPGDETGLQDLCCSCNYRNVTVRPNCYMCGHASTQEAASVSSDDAEEQAVGGAAAAAAAVGAVAEELDNQEPKKPHNPIYTNYRWPSPIAKVFVQHIRGRNAWNNVRFMNDNAWDEPTFRYAWMESGNTEFRLTHDNCMRYLAKRMSLSLEQLMEKTPHEVHAKLIGQYHGVPGFYIKRSCYY